jgi:single-stranded-DNA-specific exonuclease
MRWNVPSLAPELVRRIMADFRLSKPSAMVLANRHIPEAELGSFLRPRLKQLCAPFLLTGTERAAERLWRAIRQGERILVHGDYDTDGITSTALMSWALRGLGAEVDCFVPHRIEDGYGVTAASLSKATTERHRVVVTVDCGITGHEAAEFAKQRGIDLIITDHHMPSATLPDAYVVINPKLGCDDPQQAALQTLAGVGVAFKLCHALVKYGRDHDLGGHRFDLREGMDLVAMGTVADIVPLRGENRTLIKHGLRVLATKKRPGVRALCEIAGVTDAFTAEDISFRLAPRLNAAGRLADATAALRLLQTDSIVEAQKLAKHLDELNRDRQSCEQKTSEAARAQIAEEDLAGAYSLVVWGEGWPVGVVGIVASRLVQEFYRPALVLSIDESGEVHGSGRSIQGVDLVTTLGDCRHLLDNFGGHPMAAGLTTRREHLDTLRQTFETAVRARANEADFQRCLNLDGDLSFRDLTDRFFSELSVLSPFGQSFRAPIFSFQQVKLQHVKPAGEKHTRGVAYEQGYGFPFIAFNRRPEEFPQQPFSMAARPQLNTYKASTSPQLEVVDVQG